MSKPTTSEVYAPGFAADPSAGAGLAAPIGSLLPRLGTNELWQKVGAADVAWALLSGLVGFGHVLRLDAVYGNDAVAAPGGAPYATLAAALANAVAGDTIWIFPGAHAAPAAGFTIPDGVSLQGIDQNSCSIELLNVTADTTLVTMGDSSSLSDLLLKLTSVEHHTLTGIDFPGTTAQTVAIRNVILHVHNDTAPIGGASVVNGFHSAGVAPAVSGIDAISNTIIHVESIGGGEKRGILVDTAAQVFAVHNVNVVMENAGGAGNYIGVETNHAGAVFFGHTMQIDAPTADISQTLGTIQLAATTLAHSTANGLGFTADIYPATFVFADSGATPGGVTRYMRPGTATVSATEIKQRIATQCAAFKLSVRAIVGPGAARVDTFTVRKNGVDTGLTITLTGAQVTNIDAAHSVTFAAGDDISLQLITAAGSTLADIVATVELY